MTLADFLLARIAEDEAAARSAHPSPWKHSPWHPGRFACIEAPASMHGGNRVVILSKDPDSVMSVPHILRWEPARVLAECEAKRRIVEIHQIGNDPCDEHDASMRSIPCETLQLLALPYADHRDYQQEWRQ